LMSAKIPATFPFAFSSATGTTVAILSADMPDPFCDPDETRTHFTIR
jgi:hypothetical protein